MAHEIKKWKVRECSGGCVGNGVLGVSTRREMWKELEVGFGKVFMRTNLQYFYNRFYWICYDEFDTKISLTMIQSYVQFS